MWVDGIYRGRPDQQRLCVLVMISVNIRGEKHFLAIEDGVREYTQSGREVLLSVKARGLSAPKVAVEDGALGFWVALEELYPSTQQQRCWVHKTRNVLNVFPKSVQPKAKTALHEIWQAATQAKAEQGIDRTLKIYEPKYPTAIACLEKDRRNCCPSILYISAKHWQHLRTTNPIESTFGIIRHRKKQTNGCLTRDGMLRMRFKLSQRAEKPGAACEDSSS